MQAVVAEGGEGQAPAGANGASERSTAHLSKIGSDGGESAVAAADAEAAAKPSGSRMHIAHLGDKLRNNPVDTIGCVRFVQHVNHTL